MDQFMWLKSLVGNTISSPITPPSSTTITPPSSIITLPPPSHFLLPHHPSLPHHPLSSSLGPPRQPMKTRGNKISMDSLTIQWMVPFIAYTRETYVVRYGSAPDNLNQSSILVNGSANLNVTGAQFGVNLTGLVPYSLYYYTIVASNTEGTTTTPVMTLSFFPRRFRGGRGGASYVTPPSLHSRNTCMPS